MYKIRSNLYSGNFIGLGIFLYLKKSSILKVRKNNKINIWDTKERK